MYGELFFRYFYIHLKADLRSLEEIFWAGVFTMLKEEGKITDEIITKLMKWRHSGFNVDNVNRFRYLSTLISWSRSFHGTLRSGNYYMKIAGLYESRLMMGGGTFNEYSPPSYIA
jgi:hypothetical protein